MKLKCRAYRTCEVMCAVFIMYFQCILVRNESLTFATYSFEWQVTDGLLVTSEGTYCYVNGFFSVYCDIWTSLGVVLRLVWFLEAIVEATVLKCFFLSNMSKCELVKARLSHCGARPFTEPTYCLVLLALFTSIHTTLVFQQATYFLSQ